MKQSSAAVFLLLLFGSLVFADEFSGVVYQAPSGWNKQSTGDALAFTPPNLAPDNGVAIVLSGAHHLGGKSFSDWLTQQLDAELSGGKVLKQSEPNRQKDGSLDRVTIVRIVEDAQGTALIQMYHAISNGEKAAIAVAAAVSEEAVNNQASIIQAFFASLGIAGSVPQPPNSAGFSIVGNWSTTSYFGDIVDSTTGSFQSTAYSGEWYVFSPDGIYQHTHIAGGLIISGAVIEKGSFQVLGNQLVLNRKTSSWIPMPGKSSNRPAYRDRESPEESRFVVQMNNANEFSIKQGEGMWTTFHKKPQ